ncbi:MAG: ribosomal protein S18-alanine N-acetyltransferase [Clostridia bacterium]|nr:ribosomal protein S18-alanine N-acetyltransferase [Clostridia bacterium]
MLIREWRYEDILKISEMERDIFSDEAWSYKTLASVFEMPTFFGVLCEDEGEIAGYGGVTVAADSADIGNVAVAENYRNGGIGTNLLKKLCAVAKEKGAEKVFLEVRVSNSAAMGLYLKNGFAGAYARTRYYPDGEDCLVMVKNL